MAPQKLETGDGQRIQIDNDGILVLCSVCAAAENPSLKRLERGDQVYFVCPHVKPMELAALPKTTYSESGVGADVNDKKLLFGAKI